MKHFIQFITFIFIISSTFTSYSQLIPQQDKNGKWGYKKEGSKKFKIAPSFENAYLFSNNIAPVKTNQGFQLIDEKGNLLTKQAYDFIGWQDKIQGQEALLFVNDLIGVNINGKWGIINSQLEQIIPIEFDSIKLLNKQYLIAKKGNWGIYTTSGKAIFPHALNRVISVINNKVIALKNRAFGVIEANGNIDKGFIYSELDRKNNTLKTYTAFELFNASENNGFVVYGDSITKAAEDLVWLQRKGDWALVSIPKKENITGFQFKMITSFKNNYAIIKKNNLYGLINKVGEEILKPIYTEIFTDSIGIIRAKKGTTTAWDFFNRQVILIDANKYPEWLSSAFSNGLYLAQKGGNYGYIDRSLNEIIPFKYQHATDFSNGFAIVKSGGFSGAINPHGGWVISPVVDSLAVLSSAAFMFFDRGYWGTMGTDGIEYFVSDLTTTSQKFEEGLLINNEGKLGYINQWGRPILEPIYDDIQPYNEDYLLVQKEGFQFYATKHSTEIPQEKNCAVWSINQPLSENFIAVQYQNQAGFIDYLCRLRISVRYEAVQSFSENLAAIKIAGKWGYIDSEERLIIQPRYQTVSAFQNGYAVVQKNNLYGIIDKSGETILPFEYDAINRTENRHWLLRKGSDLGILSKDFQSIIFPKYTSLQDNSSNTVIVEKAGKFGIDNLNGVHIRFQEYDLIKHWQKSIYLFTTPPQTTILN